MKMQYCLQSGTWITHIVSVFDRFINMGDRGDNAKCIFSRTKHKLNYFLSFNDHWFSEYEL